MTYTVHSIFLTQQGEGAHIGRTAVFVRFAGCNLWSGRQQDRAKAICKFCDTEFRGGKRYASATEIVREVVRLFPGERHRMVVLTGGEPLLQVDQELLLRLREERFYTAVETNGTKPLPANVDWLCVSPKARTKLALSDADELKLVYPQQGAMPEQFANFSAPYRWLSPKDGDRRAAYTRAAAAYCAANPKWRLAIQAHKTWKIP